MIRVHSKGSMCCCLNNVRLINSNTVRLHRKNHGARSRPTPSFTGTVVDQGQEDYSPTIPSHISLHGAPSSLEYNICRQNFNRNQFHLRYQASNNSQCNKLRYVNLAQTMSSLFNSHMMDQIPISLTRQIHLSTISLKDLTEPESKVEKTVKALREKKKEKKKVEETLSDTMEEPRLVQNQPEPPPQVFEIMEPVQKSLWVRFKDEIKHYYHGFRLLGIDISIAARMLRQILNGDNLSRREYKQFTRTVSDMFRLVPFLVFVIIPFMEFLLPVAIKLFPSMLPSTFQDKSKKEEKLKTELKVKLEMAKFLQDTIEETAVHKKTAQTSQNAQHFASFIERIRSSGQQATNEEILKYSKLFEDELTLDNLPRNQLVALCKLLMLQPYGTNNFLRFQLRMKLRALMADDKMIQKEGIETLTIAEMQSASQARGMRALGLSTERLQSQLQQWLDLHLNEEIPTSLLLLSRALYLPDHLATAQQLQQTIATLTDSTTEEAKVKLAEVEGEKIDNTTRLNIIKKEEAEILKEKEDKLKEELEDKEEMERKKAMLEAEELIDTAPVLEMSSKEISLEDEIEEVTREEFKELNEVISQIADEKEKLSHEKEDLEELREDIAEYKEDIEELKNEMAEETTTVMVESKASVRLGKRVDRMMKRIDKIVDEVETGKNNLKHDIEKQGGLADEDSDTEKLVRDKKQLLRIEELEEAMRKFSNLSDEVKCRQIAELLDKDSDGILDIQDVQKVIEFISQEDVDLSPKQIEEIMNMLSKEEELEESKKSTNVRAED